MLEGGTSDGTEGKGDRECQGSCVIKYGHQDRPYKKVTFEVPIICILEKPLKSLWTRYLS